MNRFGYTLLAALLTIAIGCKRQGSDAAGGSAAAPPAAPAATPPAAAPPAPAAPAAPAAADGSGSAAAAPATGAAATGAAPAAAAADNGAGPAAPNVAMAHRAGMCPSTVLGSTTKQAVQGKAVVVTIESSDKDAIAAIQRRTDRLLGEKKDAATGVGHDQKGGHGGGQGLCPVHVPDGATAKAKHEAKGVVVMITPRDNPDQLAKEIDGRIARAADWVKTNVKSGDEGNQGGVGGGRGDDGSNHSGKGDGKGRERHKAGAAGDKKG
jgi:hypothetical protein